MENLRQLMAAYFHQDWWHEYDGSWESAVDDFARREPRLVSAAQVEIAALLARDLSDASLGEELDAHGNFRDAGEGPDAHRSWLEHVHGRLGARLADQPHRERVTPETQLVSHLTGKFPEISLLLEQHLRDQEGELLAYLLMGDVADWLHESSVTDPARVGEVLAWLETRFTDGTFDERNLIDVGIIEMLPARPRGSRILTMLPPTLRDRARVAGLFDA